MLPASERAVEQRGTQVVKGVVAGHSLFKHYARGQERQNHISQAVGPEGVRLGGSLPAVRRIVLDRPGVAAGGTVAHDAAAIPELQRRRPATVAVHMVGEADSQVYARLGDEVNTSFFIKRAWRAFDQGTTDRDPPWTGFLNEAELTCLEGMCRADLGSHKQAARLLERSAQLQDVARSRNRGMCLARLAQAAVGTADFDRTDAAAKESLRLIESGQTSTRTRRHLASVRESLRLHHDVRQARETLDLLTTHIA